MEKLKVGQSFEVVECIGNKESNHAESVKGLTGIVFNMDGYFHFIIVNSPFGHRKGALLSPHEYKRIGKITITSIKKGGSDES